MEAQTNPTEAHAPARISRLPEAQPFSRLLRLALGGAMTALTLPALGRASWTVRLEIIGVVVLLCVLYTVVHHVVSRYLGWIHPWLGAAIAVLPTLGVFLLGGIYEVGAVLFIGLSLILMAALGHPGCEVLAVPSLVLGRRTHLACILFSPIDWIEDKIVRRWLTARS